MIKTPLSTVLGGAFWTPGCTVIGGNTPTFDQQIQKLFANGEQGFYYDPNDLSAMFQDAAGTVPVTAEGQPVGLILDKSKGLQRGVNLTADFDFGTWNTVGGAIADKTSFTVTASGGVTSNVGMVVGKLYKIDIEYTTTNPTSVVSLLNGGYGGAPLLQSTTSGKISCYCTAAEALLYFRSANATVTVTKFVVQEVFGNHAFQSTSASRPILRDVPKRIDFDAVDDKLITDLPAQLTGCTVIRSVPNAGTQILTGQTIPATYEDNTNHCGLIVINRALTPSETSAITAEFDKRAGV